MMQAQIIVAPNLPPENPLVRLMHHIFLAGAIDMGAAVDWQAVVIQALQSMRCVIYNPRRAVPFTPDMLDEQIAWELDAMQQADTVLMWFPKDSKAPVAMLETGFLLPTGKLVLGVEDGFYRRRNLELTAQRFSVEVYPTINQMLIAVIDRIVVGTDS